MTRAPVAWVLRAGMTVVLTVAAAVVFAQGNPPAAKPANTAAIKIKKITGTGNQAQIRSPEFRSSSGSNPEKPPKDWVQVLVNFEVDTRSDRDWVDELTFQYFVIAKSPDLKPPFSIYKLTVNYRDVEPGKGHKAAVYLRPAAVKRFGPVVAVAVQVTLNGKVVAEDDETTIKLAEKWWTNPKVLEDPSMIVREGYLMDKYLTPFALVNVDDYEVSR